MAVTVEGTSTEGYIEASASITFSYTAGGDGLFVGVATYTGTRINSVTFNADAMTEEFDFSDGATGAVGIASYIRVAPDAGAHNVVVTAASSVEAIWAGAVGLTGLHQTTPVRTIYTEPNDAGEANPHITVVDSENGDLVIDATMTLNATIAVGAGQASWIEEDGAYFANFSCGISTESAVGANTAMTWTGGTYWAIGAMALVAAAGIDGSASDGIKFGELSRMTTSYQTAARDGILLGEGSAKQVNYFTISGDGFLFGDYAAFDALVAAGAFQGDAYQNDAYQVVITAGQVLVSVIDGIKFGEFTRMNAAWQALSGDGIRLGDGIGKQVHSFTIAVDGIKVGDAAYSILAQYAAAQDGAKFGDASAFGAHWYPRTLDGIRLGDLVLFTGDNDVFVADGLKLGDGAQAAAQMLARTADQIKFGDAGDITMTWQVSIADGVRFGDVITRILHYFTSLADEVKFRDQSRVNRPATGLLNISVGAKNAGLTFTVVNPGAGFSGTGPGAGFGADEPGVGFGTGQPGITIQGDG